jgi:hypothetical protein
LRRHREVKSTVGNSVVCLVAWQPYHVSYNHWEHVHREGERHAQELLFLPGPPSCLDCILRGSDGLVTLCHSEGNRIPTSPPNARIHLHFASGRAQRCQWCWIVTGQGNTGLLKHVAWENCDTSSHKHIFSSEV